MRLSLPVYTITCNNKSYQLYYLSLFIDIGSNNYRLSVTIPLKIYNIYHCRLFIILFWNLPVQTTGANMPATMLVNPTPDPSSIMSVSRVKLCRLWMSQSANSSAPRHICKPTRFSSVRLLCSANVLKISHINNK